VSGPDADREAGADKPFHFTDRRRFDPETGARRDPAPGDAGRRTGGVDGGGGGSFGRGGSPFGPTGAAADPGNPANAAQPISAEATAPELEAAHQEAAERTADLQRVTAEYANYRKRVDRDRQQVVLAAKAAVLTEMLPVLDDVDRAAAHGDLTGAFKTVAEKLSGVLRKLGLEQVGADGDPFDPALHEAVQFATSSEVAEPTVTEVLRHGYSISERLVRPAVVVVTGPEHEADAESGTVGDASGESQVDAVLSPVSQAGSSDGADQEPADREPADQEPADQEPADREPADREPADPQKVDRTEDPDQDH